MKPPLHGLPASPGIAIGPAWIYRPIQVTWQPYQVQDPAAEWSRLEAALDAAKSQLNELYQRATEKIGAAAAEIFQAHSMFLEDPELLEAMRRRIEGGRMNAEAAVSEGTENYAQMLLALEEEYFKARAQDVLDVARRVQYCLAGVRVEDMALPTSAVIIVAEDLAPSDTIQFDRSVILGFCTVRGGPTSHTAILARSLGVPAVVSAPLPLEELQNGDTLVLNGSTGAIILQPAEEELAAAQQQQAAGQARWDEQLAAAHQPAITLDGHRVEVVANIGGAEDARQAVEYGAEGVGLLRTEFLYLDRQSMPSEEEQIGIYRHIFALLAGRPVVVRTLDIGGDKSVSYLGVRSEPNPFLGWRAIRMIGERPEVLRSQFRALLQAGVGADLRIMLPMVSCLTEVQQARLIFEEARQSLIAEGLPAAERVQFGIMIEVPSAALLAHHIAPAVDFFSIGTNDLTQYTLAVDRTNERVARLASPFHPAVVKLIAETIRAAHAKGKWVGLCGEMAGDPLATPLLLGLGLDEFSMAAKSVPAVKQRVRSLELKACREIAEHVLGLATAEEAERYLEQAH